MTNRSCSVPIGMVTRKFYCHECGERLVRHSRTRTIKRGDPDYHRYSRIGRTHMIGDVELTEYDFKCLSCDRVVGYEEQCVIGAMQKSLGKRTLSPAEVSENMDKAQAALDRKRKIGSVIVKVLSLALVVFVLYIWLKSGDHSIRFYF